MFNLILQSATEFMDLIREKGNGEVHPELDKIELEKLRHKWGDITREPDKDEILYLFKYINFICELLGLRDKADKDFESMFVTLSVRLFFSCKPPLTTTELFIIFSFK